jgi:hypothetical protein
MAEKTIYSTEIEPENNTTISEMETVGYTVEDE